MMQAWLANADALMTGHGLAEYLKGLSVISHARQRAGGSTAKGEKRSSERERASAEVDELLSKLRAGFEPVES